MGAGEQPVPDRADIVETDVPPGREAELPGDPPARVEDGPADVGANNGAAVGERRVGDGELERRDRELPLADGQVDGVALVPDPLPGLLERPLQPAGGRHEPRSLARDIEARRMPDPEPAGPVLHVQVPSLLLAVEHRSEAIEPRVAGDRERLRQCQARVDARLDVVEDVVADGVGARAREGRIRADQPRRKPGLGDDRLERGAGRIHALGGAVDQEMARVVRIEQRAQVLRIGRGAGLVETWVARERVDGAVARVHHDRGAGVGVVVAVGVRERDSVLNGLFGDALKAQVDRELKPARGTRHADDVRAADRTTAGVDDDARLLQAAVEEPVVSRLRAGLADDRAGPKARMGAGPKLRRADLAEQPEELAPDRAARIASLR